MRHYIPLQTDAGAWVVAYANHRGEFVAVMECHDLATAYSECSAMTRRAYMEAVTQAPAPSGGNRYLRGV